MERGFGNGKLIVRSIVRKNKLQLLFAVSDGKFLLLSLAVQLNDHFIFPVGKIELAITCGNSGKHWLAVLVKHIHAVYELSVMI